MALNEEFHPLIQKNDSIRREKWPDQLRNLVEIGWTGPKINRSLTAKELQILPGSFRVNIGAQIMPHQRLSLPAEAWQRAEIFNSKQALETPTSLAGEVFPTPFETKGSFERTSARLRRAAGGIRGTTNLPGQAHRWTNPFRVSVELVRNWDGESFSGRLKGSRA